jgi:RNA polymerase sigma factor for flagellar operon FliA
MLSAKPCSTTDFMLGKEMASTRTACRRALEKAVERLDEDDRDILELRFREGLSVADIARRIGLEQRPLYGRLQRLLRKLRTDLEHAGFRRDQVLPAVRAGLELEADLDVRVELPVPVVHALVASNAR